MTLDRDNKLVPLKLPSSSQPYPRVQPLGGVRCYWALLVPTYNADGSGQNRLELKFAYLDPVLSTHLGAQNIALTDHGVIEFIHEAEREQARKDLASAIQNDDLQGSVTRMRFPRLSRVRTMLGAQPQEVSRPPELEKIMENAEYLVIDLVLNWVADGLLLAFFHAIKDRDPQANNDPQRKHEGWSNYCGAGTMFPEEQIQVLQQAVASNVVLPARTRYPPTRVFQLQATGGPHQPPSLLFSWPPPRPPNAPGHGDGMYDAEEYAELMRGVDMDPSMLTTKPGEVRTNCTTRFGAEHSIRTEGVYRHVNSVFIPYGSLVFACYQTKKTIELRPSGTTEAWSAPQQPSPATSPVVAGGGEWRPQQSEFDNSYPSSSQFGRDYPPPGPPGGPGYGAPGYGPGFGRMNDAAPAQPRPTGSSSRPLVRPPGDVEKCRGCGTRESPEWRKGENGVKDLCNACGLKLARAVAKREGRQKPRKKDKT